MLIKRKDLLELAVNKVFQTKLSYYECIKQAQREYGLTNTDTRTLMDKGELEIENKTN